MPDRPDNVKPSTSQEVPIAGPMHADGSGQEAGAPDDSIIDELLQGADADKAIDDKDLDAVLQHIRPAGVADMDAAVVEQDNSPKHVDMDATVASATAKSVGDEHLAAAASSEGIEEVALSEELVDTLAAQVQVDRSKTPPPMPESVSSSGAAAIAPEPILAQPAPLRVPTPLATPGPPVSEKKALPTHVSKFSRLWLPYFPRVSLRKRDAPRLGAAMAAGLVFSIGTFFFLSAHRYRTPDLTELAGPAPDELRAVARAAQDAIREGRYEDAVKRLDQVMTKPLPSSERADMEFLRVEALYRGLPAKPTEAQTEALQTEIDHLAEKMPSHPRLPEALEWKADAYERTGLLQSARDAYAHLLEAFVSADNRDAVLLKAGRLCLKTGQADDAVSHFNRLMEELPRSPLTSEAKLALAEAYASLGRQDDARSMIRQVADLQSGTRIGAEAFARLAQMAVDEANYDEAIRLLENRLDTVVAFEGNDRLYLLLAKAYLAKGRPEDAERKLRELIDFFPDTEALPSAYIELSKALEQRGMRREALRIAAQAVRRYPKNPAVLQCQAELLGLAGDHREAAAALMAAEEVGARNPEVLLAAGRHFSEAGEWEEARDAYERLVRDYPSSPQALQGNIEAAKTLYRLGRVRQAIERLEGLAGVYEGRPQQLPVLTALCDMYRELGFDARAVELARDIATFSSEPTLLAQAAVVLLTSGAEDDGLAVASRVDLSRVNAADAYACLVAQGVALLRAVPERALEKLERAYEDYPPQRTAEGDEALLRAYLTMGRPARARTLVMELAARTQTHPAEGARFQRAAILWGDALYNKEDYQAAADAYSMACGVLKESNQDTVWAKYQWANALLYVNNFDTSLALYDEVAAGKSPWKEKARAKAEYVRLQRRLRGLPETAATPTEGS